VLSTEDENLCEMQEIHLYHPADQSRHRILSGKEISRIEPLLEDVMKDGNVVCDLPSLEKIRAKREEDMQFLYPGVKRIMNPHHYHVSLTEKLWSLKQNLVKEYSNGEKDA
jgi:nicotinate phosphoribosyltransferase